MKIVETTETTTIVETTRVTTVVLIECGKAQCKQTVLAKFLYVGVLFKKSWLNMTVNFPHADRFILSTKHHLLDPEALTAPYNVTFAGMSVKEKKAWAAKVISQLKEKGYELDTDEFVFYAGKNYTRYLVAPLGPIKNFRLMFDGCKGIGYILHRLNQLNNHSNKTTL